MIKGVKRLNKRPVGDYSTRLGSLPACANRDRMALNISRIFVGGAGFDVPWGLLLLLEPPIAPCNDAHVLRQLLLELLLELLVLALCLSRLWHPCRVSAVVSQALARQSPSQPLLTFSSSASAVASFHPPIFLASSSLPSSFHIVWRCSSSLSVQSRTPLRHYRKDEQGR